MAKCMGPVTIDERTADRLRDLVLPAYRGEPGAVPVLLGTLAAVLGVELPDDEDGDE